MDVDFVLRTECSYFNIEKENIISEAVVDIALHSALDKIKNLIQTINLNNGFDVPL